MLGIQQIFSIFYFKLPQNQSLVQWMSTVVLQEPRGEANADFNLTVLNHSHTTFLETSVFVWDRSIILSKPQALTKPRSRLLETIS